MKKTDIALIALIASIMIVGAFFATSALLGPQTGGTIKVKTIQPITSEVVPPNPDIFNEDAINPAVEVQVGSGGS